MVPEWCQGGAGVVPEWCHSGPGTVPGWCRRIARAVLG